MRNPLLSFGFLSFLIVCLIVPRNASAQSAGAACSLANQNTPFGAVNSMQYLACLSSVWTLTPVKVGAAIDSCASGAAGEIQWTGAALQYCNGSAWSTIEATNSTSGIYLGTSASATNPQRSGDATTGLFSPATGTVGVSIGGSEITGITATGVGIGTNAPANELDVNGSIAVGTYAGTAAGTTNSLIVSGNIGIGSTVPAASLDVTGQIYSRRYSLTDGATIALDWNNGNIQSVTLGGNRAFTFANGQNGAHYVVIIRQDGTGSRTVTWPNSVRWPGGTAPTLTSTASKTDYIGFIYNGVSGTYDGISISQNF